MVLTMVGDSTCVACEAAPTVGVGTGVDSPVMDGKGARVALGA